MTVTVTSMKILQRPTKTASGKAIRAYYNAHDDDIAIQSLQLVSDAEGRWNVWPPTLTGASRSVRRREGRGVHWRAGGKMKGRFLKAGIESYFALGGIDPKACADA